MTLLLTGSIVLLLYCMRTRSPKIENLSDTFKAEFTNLKITLILFDLTYILRWCSDYYVIPWFFDGNGLTKCDYVDPKFQEAVDVSFCCNFNFIMYYTLTSFVWDWAPIYIILYFHHRNFKIKRTKSIESDSGKPILTGQNDSISFSQSGSTKFMSQQ